MKFYHTINVLLNKITFSYKTRLLIGIIASGMMTIGFLMLISIYALKYDYENLFQRRTMPLVELEEIKDLYSVNIHDTLYDLSNKEILLKNAEEVITLALKLIDDKWRNYDAFVKTDIGGLPEFASWWLNLFLLTDAESPKSIYQEGLVSKIEIKMKMINKKTLYSLDLLKIGKDKMSNKIVNEASLEINALNIYLSNLINNHLKQAINEKNKTEKIFHTSIIMLVLLIGMIFFLSIITSVIIINHFTELHNSLEDKVNAKTKELQNLNTSLERRVAKEVDLNRKKDQIMFQQSRLASLGEMLQNIAHQWRQPLSALSVIIQSFETKHMSGKLTGEFIEDKVKEADLLANNMSETLEDFRTFFNPNKSKKEFDLREAIEKSIDLTHFVLEKNGISLELFMHCELKIFGFKNELSHVILNLINNAKDALEKYESDKRIQIFVKPTTQEIHISVVDNAGGVDKAIIDKIFDPYFTTKHQSVGTGIGLYMSKQIIEQHMQGKITCKNIQHKMGTGRFYECAMFTVSIPYEKDLDAKT